MNAGVVLARSNESADGERRMACGIQALAGIGERPGITSLTIGLQTSREAAAVARDFSRSARL